MDWERVRYFAQAILTGLSKADLEKQGYFRISSDDDAWSKAQSDVVKYANQVPEADIQVAILSQKTLDEILGKQG